jgi:hypothetical protein
LWNHRAYLGFYTSSTVFVEADLTMKDQPPAEDGSRRPPIPFLMHRELFATWLHAARSLADDEVAGTIQVIKSPHHAEEGASPSSTST